MSSVMAGARALMAAISPITGTRSVGTATVTAAAGTVNIPRNYYAYPVIDGKAKSDWLFKVDSGPNLDGSWDVGVGGVQVQFISNLGGIRYNIPAGTPLIFDPPIGGLVVAAPQTDALFTGGISATGFGALKNLLMFESMDGTEASLDLRRSEVDEFPACVITFSDIQPSDGTSVATTQRESKVGTRKSLYKVSYILSVISSRTDLDHERRHEGLECAENIMKLITDRRSVEAPPDNTALARECLSNPGGVQIRQMFRESGPQPEFQKFYIYNIQIATLITLETTDTRTYSDWLLAVLNVDKPQSPPLPNQGPFRLVDDMRIDLS